jgi:adenine-specific DNA-methyltransferase
MSFDTASYARTLSAGFTAPFTPEAHTAIERMRRCAEEGKLDETKALITTEYSPGGPVTPGGWERMFWTEANARRIDAARQLIDSEPEEQRPFLLASLIKSADAVANTTGHYGAFLKSFQRNAQRPLDIKPLHTDPHPAPSGAIILDSTLETDAASVLQRLSPSTASASLLRDLTIVYADPPYNQTQYSGGYAPLTVLNDYEGGVVNESTKTGRLLTAYKSRFSTKRAETVRDAVHQLVRSATEVADFLVMSYSNEGTLSTTELEQVLGPTALRTDVTHQRYESQKDGKRARTHTTTTEHIFVVPLKVA